jgi:putative peptidoglycan lipid II flippase
VLAPGYFARQDTATPFRFASISVVTNVTLNLALFSWWGHVGLAFATSVAGWVNALLLLRGLLRDGRYQPGRGLFLACVRASVSSAVMLALVFMLVPDAGQWLEADEFTRLQWLALAVAGGALVYVLGLLILGERLRYVMHRA